MPMKSVVRNVKMNACRNATNSSSKLIATLPATTERADAQAEAGALRAGGHDERQQHREQDVAGDHVGEKSDGEREHLRDQPDDLDRHQQRRQPERTGTEMREVRLCRRGGGR